MTKNLTFHEFEIPLWAMEANAIVEAFFQQLEPSLSENAVNAIRPLIRVQTFPKKHILMREGQHSNAMYLMVSGAARGYYLSDGTEVHTWFSFENELVGSLRNFLEAPSRETIELLEDSTLLEFNLRGIKLLMGENLEVANLVNASLATHAMELEDRLFDTHLRSAQERYETHLEDQPEVFQRVPLTYIASYLGISRETLSRLRAK